MLGLVDSIAIPIGSPKTKRVSLHKPWRFLLHGPTLGGCLVGHESNVHTLHEKYIHYVVVSAVSMSQIVDGPSEVKKHLENSWNLG